MIAPGTFPVTSTRQRPSCRVNEHLHRDLSPLPQPHPGHGSRGTLPAVCAVFGCHAGGNRPRPNPNLTLTGQALLAWTLTTGTQAGVEPRGRPFPMIRALNGRTDPVP